MVSIGLTNDGDWAIDANGLVLKHNEDEFLQRVQLYLRTTPGDDEKRPAFGFDRGKYLGKQNSEREATRLRNDLYDGLLGLAGSTDYGIFVDVYPTDVDKLKVEITITSPSGITKTLTNTITIGQGDNSLFGYNIKGHLPYDETTPRPIIEILKLQEAANEIRLAHMPINSNVKVYANDGSVRISDNQIDPDSSEMMFYNWQLTTPSGFVYTDLSGDIISGHLLANTFMLDRNLDGEIIGYGIVNDNYYACNVSGDTDALYQRMVAANALSGAGIAYSIDNNIIIQPADLTIDKNVIRTVDMISGFNLDFCFLNTVTEAVSIKSKDVQLDKHSVGYFGRTDSIWTALLSTTIPSGTYLISYTTFDFE